MPIVPQPHNTTATPTYNSPGPTPTSLWAASYASGTAGRLAGGIDAGLGIVLFIFLAVVIYQWRKRSGSAKEEDVEGGDVPVKEECVEDVHGKGGEGKLVEGVKGKDVQGKLESGDEGTRSKGRKESEESEDEEKGEEAVVCFVDKKW